MVHRPAFSQPHAEERNESKPEERECDGCGGVRDGDHPITEGGRRKAARVSPTSAPRDAPGWSRGIKPGGDVGSATIDGGDGVQAGDFEGAVDKSPAASRPRATVRTAYNSLAPIPGGITVISAGGTDIVHGGGERCRHDFKWRTPA